MAARASRVAAADPRLDGTVDSVRVVALMLGPAVGDPDRLRDLAAYLGEVLLREGPTGRWAAGADTLAARPGDPVVRWGRWEYDPGERLRYHAAPRAADDTLPAEVAELARYVRDPRPRTARRLGWHTVVTEEPAAPDTGPRRRWWRR